MNIDGRNPRERVFIVAEIGNNHEGSFTLAEELVGRAAESGADAVKFQTSDPDRFVAHTDTARLERLKQFRLSHEQIASLAALARRCGVVFFSTPLDLDTARFLDGLQPVFKIASGDNTFFPLIDLLASFGKPLIISTGLADLVLLDELRDACGGSGAAGGDPALAFLHCVASYPVPAEQVNLAAIRTMATRFPEVVIGYSDHTLGIEASVGAVAVGARIIEKHFTLESRTLGLSRSSALGRSGGDSAPRRRRADAGTDARQRREGTRSRAKRDCGSPCVAPLPPRATCRLARRSRPRT